MENGKWIVRGASLALLLGFFLPSVTVSCSSYAGASQSLSLAYISDTMGQSILYLFPILVIVAGAFTFFRGSTSSQEISLLWGQAGALALGIITLLISLISLNNQMFGVFEVTPAFGSFILAGGVIAFGYGWLMQAQNQGINRGGSGYSTPRSPVQQSPGSRSYQPPVNVNSAAYSPGNNSAFLILVAGNLSAKRIPISSSNFSIGRSSDNHLRLPDPTISRTHALLRQAQGMWFLQDQRSAGGTFVNGKKIQAGRIYEGDEIGIGPFRFKFHSGGN